MKYIVIKLVKQLNNIAQEVGKKKKKRAKMVSEKCFPIQQL